jgi:hypothetical protein
MTAPPTATSDDIDLADLPPLDGDARDEGDVPGATPGRAPADDDDGIEADGSASDLDDTTGENDDPHPEDVEVDAGHGKWLDEPADARDLDVGEFEIDSADASPAGLDNDDADAPGEDPALGEGLEASGLDSGEEGPEAPDEELLDEDLPELGQAEDDEIDEELTGVDLPPPDEAPGLGGALGWAANPWTRVGAPIPLVSAVAVACTARGAFVAGVLESQRASRPVELVRVDLEGGCQTVSTASVTGRIAGLAADGDLLAIRTDTDAVFVSLAGKPFEAAVDAVQAKAVLVLAGTVWVRSSAGALLSSTRGGPFVERVSPSDGAGVVAAVVEEGTGQVVALLADPAGRPVGVARGAVDGLLSRGAIDFGEPAASYGPPMPGVFAAHGPRLAYAARGGLVFGSAELGWETRDLGGEVVALSFVDGGEGVVALVYSESDDTTGLVRVEAGGAPRVMALLGATHSDIESNGRALGWACDDTRGVVWVVGGFGVAAFSTR